MCGGGGTWIQTPTLNETGSLALRTSNEKCKIFRDAKATGVGFKAFCLCPFFFMHHTKPSKTRAEKKWNMEELNHSWPIMESCCVWRYHYGIWFVVFLLMTLFVFCIVFSFFFAVVLNIKQLKLELGRNEKPSLMLNFSFAHMRARQGGFIGLFFAVHWVWSCCRSWSKHQQKRDHYLCHDQRNKSHIWANGACEKTVILG